MKNKEQIYDAEIFGLMGQIIAICQKHKISMFATFDIPNDEDDSLACTTCTADESGKPSERIRKFNAMAAKEHGSPVSGMSMIVTKADGSKEITAFIS